MRQKIFRILLGKSWLGVLFHLLLILGISFALINYFFNGYLPDYTRHGEIITVPNLERMTVEEVEAKVGELKLRYQIEDTIYSPRYPRLTVVKQQPLFGEKVKQDRRIYITINAPDPPSIVIDSSIYVRLREDNVTSIINTWVNELGMKEENIEIKYVKAPFKDFGYESFVAGKEVEVGDSYSIESKVVIEVGDGLMDAGLVDSLHSLRRDSVMADSALLQRLLDAKNNPNLPTWEKDIIESLVTDSTETTE